MGDGRTQAQTLSAADTGTVKTVDITDILLTLWLAGVIACVLWQVGYYRLIRSLKGTRPNRSNARICTRFCRSSAPTWLLTGNPAAGILGGGLPDAGRIYPSDAVFAG